MVSPTLVVAMVEVLSQAIPTSFMSREMRVFLKSRECGWELRKVDGRPFSFGEPEEQLTYLGEVHDKK